jgi:hypothetical protein
MKHSSNLKKLAVAVSLLSGSQAALALTPWVNGAPDFVVYTSGGAAQDNAILAGVTSILAASGTVDIFQDTVSGSVRVSGSTTTKATNGGNFTAYYFTGAGTGANAPIAGSGLSDSTLAGKKILLVKRTLGAAGYGVIPLVSGQNLDQLNPFKSTTSQASTGWKNSGTTHLATINNSTASTYLTQVPSQGGFLGVDAPSLLTGLNYPTQVTEVSTNALTTPWSTTVGVAALNSAVTRIPTGGEVYGVAVTDSLYNVLQAAEIAAGTLTLPSGHSVGAYSSDADLPTLSRSLVASLLAGEILSWTDVNVNVGGTLQSLYSFSTATGVTAPTSPAVAVALRNQGAAVGALHYAKFLGYPYAANATAPAISNATPDGSGESSAFPLIKLPISSSDTDNTLNDWQYGDNVTGHNSNGTSGAAGSYPTYWGLGINTADRNTTSSGFRYVKIDGVAPTVANVQAGAYPIWGEGEVTISNNSSITNGQTLTFLTDFAHALSNKVTAAAIDPTFVQPYGGIPGIFATPSTDTTDYVDANGASGGTTTFVPGAVTPYFAPFSHEVSGHTTIGIVPAAVDGTGNNEPVVLLH